MLAANPAATIVRENSRVAVGHGLDREGEGSLREAIGRPEPAAALAGIVAGQEEATVVLADAATPGGPRLDAWRGATSNYEVYLADNGLGRPPSVADAFRDALASVASGRRSLDPAAAADHLLFGTVPGPRTLVAAVGRLGHGEHYRWHAGRAERRIFDSLVARPRPDQAPIDGIDAGLARAIRRLPLADGCATLLSGGIDSSLLHTYLPPGTPTVSSAVDSPEFARERTYAEQASRLLGTVHQVFTAPEDDFLRLLVDAIRLSGLPARHPQPVLYNLAYRFPAPCFITGEFGDQLFGLKPTESYVESFARRRWLRLAEGMRLRRLLPRGKVAALERRLDHLRRLAAPLDDWQSSGPRYAIRGDAVLLERILGTTTMRQRIEARADYVATCFRSEERDADPLFAHLEFGHMVVFLCCDNGSHWRQMAYAQGKNLLTPYGCRSVVEAAIAVPRGRRYSANGRIKYLLKDLLKRRLPGYDVDTAKGGGDLPIQRYFGSENREGMPILVDRTTDAVWRAARQSSSMVLGAPLKDAFERYAMPDLVDRDAASATRAVPDQLTWKLLTLAIWRDEVLGDRTLAPAANTRVLAV
ncbi:MAG: asparagine synthase-related protein [Dongiaceae bacterium]